MRWVGYLALALIVAAAACDLSNDPDAFAVHFVNDLGQPVVLALVQQPHRDKHEMRAPRVP